MRGYSFFYQRLVVAVCDAYALTDIENLLSFELELELESISTSSGKEDIVKDIIRKAQKEKWLDDFVEAVYKGRPNDQKLASVRDWYVSQTMQRGGKLRNEPCIVPIAVAAMIRPEADDLMNESVFEDNADVAASEIDEFREFKEALLGLRGQGPDDLMECYGDLRQDWKPFTPQGSTIADIISGVLEHIYEHSNEVPYLEPDFTLSERLFSEDDEVSRQAVAQLQKGGILIIDTVSVFYPLVKRRLSGGVGGHPREGVLVLSPFDTAALTVNELPNRIIIRHMVSAAIRFDECRDLCLLSSVGSLPVFKHRLFNILPQAIVHLHTKKAHPANVQRMHDMLGEPASGFGPAEYYQGAR